MRCGPLLTDGYARDPLVVAEVLSPSTLNNDRGRKAAFYQGLQTLRAYLIVYADEARVELWSRGNGPDATMRILGRDDTIPLPDLDGKSPSLRSTMAFPSDARAALAPFRRILRQQAARLPRVTDAESVLDLRGAARAQAEASLADMLERSRFAKGKTVAVRLDGPTPGGARRCSSRSAASSSTPSAAAGSTGCKPCRPRTGSASTSPWPGARQGSATVMTPDPSAVNLADLAATELLRLYASRDLSPVAVTQAVIARAEAAEAAAARPLRLRAGRGARRRPRLEARWMRGDALPLDGGAGHRQGEHRDARRADAARHRRPGRRAPEPARRAGHARLREDGAVILAATTMPDYGMLSSGLSSFHPLTRNPWDLSKGPGGSSAGSGAPAAAGYGPIHLGTISAARSACPRSCVAASSATSRATAACHRQRVLLGRCAGPLTRTVADAALAMRSISRPDDRDPTGLPRPTCPGSISTVRR